MPVNLTLSALASALGKAETREDLVTAISTDSRTIGSGSVFVAIKGEKFDGHDFVADVAEKGALAVVSQIALPPGMELEHEGRVVPVYVVPDTVLALGQLAARVRQDFTGPVIGVTGSVGKTTTKELLATVLETMFTVAKSDANFNNEIGLPQTIFSASENATVWVLEMGMRGAGQIAALGQIARPTIGVITGIGLSHIELLGSREKIAHAKAELFQSLGDDAVCVYPTTDDYAATLHDLAHGKELTVGIDAKADVSATELTKQENGWRFTIHSPWGTTKAFLPSPGRFNIQNALLAVAVGGQLGVPLESMAKALMRFEAPTMRLELLTASSGAQIISDCYNAAPDSMVGALQTLAETSVASGGQRIAVIGEMRELGNFAAEAHKMVGRVAAKLKLDFLVLVGEATQNLSAAAIAGGFPREKIHYFDKTENAAEAIAFIAQKDDVILVKGSRAMQLEKVVAALTKSKSTGGVH